MIVLRLCHGCLAVAENCWAKLPGFTVVDHFLIVSSRFATVQTVADPRILGTRIRWLEPIRLWVKDALPKEAKDVGASFSCDCAHLRSATLAS